MKNQQSIHKASDARRDDEGVAIATSRRSNLPGRQAGNADEAFSVDC